MSSAPLTERWSYNYTELITKQQSAYEQSLWEADNDLYGQRIPYF